MRIFKNRLREFVLTRRYPAETVDLSHLGHCVLKMTINVCKIKKWNAGRIPRPFRVTTLRRGGEGALQIVGVVVSIEYRQYRLALSPNQEIRKSIFLAIHRYIFTVDIMSDGSLSSNIRQALPSPPLKCTSLKKPSTLMIYVYVKSVFR
jgi:hypothetical protein